MSDKIYSINEIKTIVTPLATRYGVDRVYLFGSYARGEATHKSDLDFAIDKGRIRGLEFAGLMCDLEDVFDKNIDLITTASYKEHDPDKYFVESIERDMVVIYEQ
ncbi:MAG: nucleotidyltransferase domain-containing protein [Oscillospiraceae bacterium]|nr:nucleotidyltransferase domain-containing protein [Oscillospiraceae bacterium]